ncbi:lipase family protein [Pseudonocardia acaciae]|uniref:lipase family protein n=1 Tax=Pseudonocardia acaciae TaxID=551276 RepID=UPI00049176F6|nr:lipase family protein [Pseudonocardia acaciae]
MTTSITIDHQASGYSDELAYGLANAAALAYQDQPTVEAEVGRWGFDRVRHHQTTFTPPFPLQDTQAYTAASDKMIITAFRGTEVAQLRDWLADTSTPPWPGPAGRGFVHYGFAQALESVYPDVLSAITELRDQGQSVWFTGHSLGGALAMLAGVRLYLEDPHLLASGIYTFGQPRTCDRILALAHDDALAKRTYRFVNNNDIVPHLPPEPAFHHVNALRYIDSHGKVHESMPLFAKLPTLTAAGVAEALAPASRALRDHGMKNYIAALQGNLTRA